MTMSCLWLENSLFLFNFPVNFHYAMHHDIPLEWIAIGQFLAVISLVLYLLSFVFIVLNRQIAYRDKILWLLGTFLLPILGPILFLTLGRQGR